MRLRYLMIIVALAFSASGCASLNPKNWHWPDFRSKRSRADRDRDHDPPPDPPAFSQRTAPAFNGVLAGQVIDGFNQKKPGTTIQVAAADGGNDPPQEVIANDQGYFTIQGLQPGKRYRLSARSQRGNQVLAGTSLVTPPNAVVLIKVSEDLASTAVPPSPQAAKPANGAQTQANPGGSGPGLPVHNALPPVPPSTIPPVPASVHPRSNREQSWSPNAAPRYLYEPDRGANARAWDGAGGVERASVDEQIRPLVVPRRVAPAPSPPQPAPTNDITRPSLGTPRPIEPQAPPRPEFQTFDEPVAKVDSGVLLNLPPPAPFPARSSVGGPLAKSAGGSPRRASRSIADPVPSCILDGDRLENFALNDLRGRPYQLRDHRSKLVLLDFWGTWCSPCVKAIPDLVDLQRRYGPRGLEVLGIAYEEGTPAEQTQRVNYIRQRQKVNYKLLLGQGEECPVRNKLGISSFPTLVLLDQDGEIVWRGEGLTTQNKARLESEIRRRLGR